MKSDLRKSKASGSTQQQVELLQNRGSMNYQEFLANKSQTVSPGGFEPLWMPDFLYDFQKSLLDWSVRKGKCAIFADCGLGKTPLALAWAENIFRKTGRPVIIITPLAVAQQFVREGQKFGIDVQHSKTGTIMPRITVTNYERLHYFNPDDFAGVVCDESSAIKAFDGKRRKQVTRFLSKVQYRMMDTATAAPNDYIELGTHSEALGIMTQSEMLSQFFHSMDDARHSLFKEDDFWNRAKWAFKAHAATPFWRWVCSWARALRKPSDLGFDDARFVLPPLLVNQITVKNNHLLPGELFPVIAHSLREQREERRATLKERCDMVAQLVNGHEPAIVWCHMNIEGKRLAQIIPGAKEVYGSQEDDEKEAILNEFATGNLRVLVTKPKIAAWGLNLQHCHHETFFPSHSFEQYYQGVRRCWRFGQTQPVQIDIVTTEGEANVTRNLDRKAKASEAMFSALVSEMNNVLKIEVNNKHIKPMESPAW